MRKKYLLAVLLSASVLVGCQACPKPQSTAVAAPAGPAAGVSSAKLTVRVFDGPGKPWDGKDPFKFVTGTGALVPMEGTLHASVIDTKIAITMSLEVFHFTEYTTAKNPAKPEEEPQRLVLPQDSVVLLQRCLIAPGEECQILYEDRPLVSVKWTP